MKRARLTLCLACVLGELSGQVFPLTQEEYERIQEEGCQFLAEYESRKAEMSQERKAEPLWQASMQEA